MILPEEYISVSLYMRGTFTGNVLVEYKGVINAKKRDLSIRTASGGDCGRIDPNTVPVYCT